MGLQTKTIGRMPTDHGPYDPQLAYGEKFVVTLFGCGWESKENNNTSAPATLNEQTGVITPNANWIKRWGSYEQWLIDNGYKKVDAANVKDGNHTQHEINNAVANEIGTNSTPSSIKGRVTNLESAVGSGGSVDSRIASAVNTERNRAEGVESGHNTRIEALETAVGSGGSVDSRISSAVAAEAERAQAAEADRYTKSETYTKTEVNGLVDTPHQEYVTVDAYSALPATGSKDTVYRVSNYNGSTSQVDASVYSEYAWNGSQYIFLCVKSQVGEVFDISAYNNNAKYADLAAALNGGANIPQSLQKGGMSVKFVQSSDNKYVQYRLMATSFSTDTTQWQGVVIESNPESKSLIESRGAFKDIHDNIRKFVASGVVEPLNFVENSIIHYDSEFEGSDNNLTGNIIPGVNSVYVLPVDPTKKYYINRISKYYYDICLYDESMIFISTLYTYNQTIGQTSSWDMAVRIPSNCRYFAFERNYLVDPYVGYESNYSAWQNDGSWINTAQNQINVIDDEKNVMFRYINIVDGAKRYNDVTFENANQSTVNGVIIPGNKTIYICEINSSLLYYINRISVYYYNIVLYDNNMSFISTLYNYETSIGHTRYFDENKQFPSNCKYVAFLADYTGVLPYIGEEAEYISWQNEKKYQVSDSIILPLKHVDIFLPSDIYVANGRTIELYNNQICLQADKVHIQWICSVGLALERKFSITAISDTVGNNYPLTINVFDDDFNLLATKTITIHIVSNVIQSAKRIVNIGDSLSYSDKSQFSEMRLLSNQLLEFVGTKDYIATASDNVLYAGKIDGRPGFDTTKFLAGTGSSYYSEEHNSFWDGSKFNFSYYVANTLNNVTPDAVFIWLGTNEMNNLTTFLTNMQTIVDSVREYSNTIKIFIVNTIYRSNQNGIGRQGAVEGYNPSNGVFKYKEDYKVMEMMKNLYEQFNGESNIYVVPLALQMDSEYNYGQQEIDVNPRNTYKTIYPVDSIHPRKTGQLQTADVFFSMLCGLL